MRFIELELLAIILGFLMSFVHFMGEELEHRISGYREKIVSFGAGVSTSYIFVQLLPEFHSFVGETSVLLYSFPLIGFSSIHLVEKFLAKSDIQGESLKKDYAELHSIFLFLYHGSIGYLLASLLEQNTVSGLLFFTPLLIHIAISSFSVTELHESVFTTKFLKLGISLAPLLGVFLQLTETVSPSVFRPVFGTVLGMFFYIVIRDSIPENEKGKPLEFGLGVLLYLAVILASQVI